MQKAIPNTNELLLVDEHGVVVSYRRSRVKYIKPSFHKDSRYPCVYIYVNNKTVCKSVIKLVAELFVVNPDPSRFTEAILIDQNPNNSCPENIMWVTKSYLHIKATRIRDGVKQKYSSRFHGVYRQQSGWVTELSKSGHRYHIGYFSTQRAARNARLQFEAEHPELLDN